MKILLFLLLFLTVGCLNHSLIRSQRKELVVDGVPTRVRLYSKNTNEYYVVFHGDYFSGVASKTIHYVFKEDIHNKNLYDGYNKRFLCSKCRLYKYIGEKNNIQTCSLLS